MAAVDLLREVLTKELDRFDKESQKHKRLHRRAQTAIIVLTALSTVVAAAGLILPPLSDKAGQFVVVCLTASTAAVASWAEMRHVRELWQHEREVYYALLDVQRGLDFLAAVRDVTPKEIQDTYDRIAAILGSSSQKWARIQEKANT